jgi:hypothetical protein
MQNPLPLPLNPDPDSKKVYLNAPNKSIDSKIKHQVVNCFFCITINPIISINLIIT